MYGVVDFALDNNSSLFEWYPELISAHQRLKDGQAWLDKYAQVQEVNTTGLTNHKKVLKAALIIAILKFSAALRAYGTSTKNDDLKVEGSLRGIEPEKNARPYFVGHWSFVV